MKVKLFLLVLLLPACATDGTQRSKWDYYKPENVKCGDKAIKICRQYGPHLICQCVNKGKYV